MNCRLLARPFEISVALASDFYSSSSSSSSFETTDVGAPNEITIIGGERSAVPTLVGWDWNPIPAD
jgi:hypothetical protein